MITNLVHITNMVHTPPQYTHTHTHKSNTRILNNKTKKKTEAQY